MNTSGHPTSIWGCSMAVTVNVENFVRAETDRMFGALQAQASGINCWRHSRAPASLDQQTVIRMNRDTLYSFAIVDISSGATLTIPDSGGRYMSVMTVNQDHYINRVFHEAGEHELTTAEFDTPYSGSRCGYSSTLPTPKMSRPSTRPGPVPALRPVQRSRSPRRNTTRRAWTPPDRRCSSSAEA